jgi:hypothetical protein
MQVKFLLTAILNLAIALTLLPGCKKESSLDPASDPSSALFNPSSAIFKDNGIAPQDNGITSGEYWVYYNHELIHVDIEAVSMPAPQGTSNVIYDTHEGAPLTRPFLSVLNALPNNGNGNFFRDVHFEYINPLKGIYQFYNESDILAASAAKPPIIKSTFTDKIYKVSIIK